MLGVTFNTNLNWTLHFNNLCKAFSSKLHALRILKDCLTDSDLKIVYYALLSSLLDYAAPLFMNATCKGNNILNRCILRAHKLICGSCCDKNYLGTIESRRGKLSLAHYNKIRLNPNHTLLQFLPAQSCRSKRIIIPACTLNSRLNSFEIQCAIMYNNSINN